MRWLCMIFLLLGVLDAKAFDVIEQPADTPLVGFKGKPSFFFTLDNTASFVGGKSATTNELRFGLDFKKKLKLGLGYGQLVSDIVVNKDIVTERTGNDSVVPANLSLSFFSANAEYVFFNSKRWQISTPFQIGLGSTYFLYYEADKSGKSVQKRTDEGTVVVSGLSAVATYRILRWVGLSAGLGYRVGILNNDKVEESFNSPVYTFKFRIFFGEIYKSVFPRGISGKRDPPYSSEEWD
ncbi:MAG: hypothetical protein ACU4F9_08070 [Arcticibacter sp.]